MNLHVYVVSSIYVSTILFSNEAYGWSALSAHAWPMHKKLYRKQLRAEGEGQTQIGLILTNFLPQNFLNTRMKRAATDTGSYVDQSQNEQQSGSEFIVAQGGDQNSNTQQDNTQHDVLANDNSQAEIQGDNQGSASLDDLPGSRRGSSQIDSPDDGHLPDLQVNYLVNGAQFLTTRTPSADRYGPEGDMYPNSDASDGEEAMDQEPGSDNVGGADYNIHNIPDAGDTDDTHSAASSNHQSDSVDPGTGHLSPLSRVVDDDFNATLLNKDGDGDQPHGAASQNANEANNVHNMDGNSSPNNERPLSGDSSVIAVDGKRDDANLTNPSVAETENSTNFAHDNVTSLFSESSGPNNSLPSSRSRTSVITTHTTHDHLLLTPDSPSTAPSATTLVTTGVSRRASVTDPDHRDGIETNTQTPGSEIPTHRIPVQPNTTLVSPTTTSRTSTESDGEPRRTLDPGVVVSLHTTQANQTLQMRRTSISAITLPTTTTRYANTSTRAATESTAETTSPVEQRLIPSTTAIPTTTTRVRTFPTRADTELTAGTTPPRSSTRSNPTPSETTITEGDESQISYVMLKLSMNWASFCNDQSLMIKMEVARLLAQQQPELRADQIMYNGVPTCPGPTTGEVAVQIYVQNDRGQYDRELTRSCYRVMRGQLTAQTPILQEKMTYVSMTNPSRQPDQVGNNDTGNNDSDEKGQQSPEHQDEDEKTSGGGSGQGTDQGAKTPEQPSTRRSGSLSDPGVLVAIALATLGVVSCLGVAALQIAVRRRNRLRRVLKRTIHRSASMKSTDSIQLAAVTKSRPNSGLYNPALDITDSLLEPTHQMNLKQLIDFCSDEKRIVAEYEKLPNKMPRLSVVPTGEEDKNRFANVLPLALTRVKLLQDGPESRSSYINANYITGPDSQCQYYIATQAPTEDTIADFWTMVWQQGTKAIVMLTQMEEDGQAKCVPYWPDFVGKSAAQKHGDFLIELKNKEVCQEYIASELQITHLRKIENRPVFHFWYTCWPTKSLPEPISLVKLVLDSRPKYEDAGVPVIVHCSPGTGRTGTFIALDQCMHHFENRRIVDVMKTVYSLRQERAGAVQSKEQYILLYQAAREYASIIESPGPSAASSATTLHALLPSS